MNRRELNRLVARMQAPAVSGDPGTMLDSRNQAKLEEARARRDDLIQQARDAAERGDYKAAYRIGVELRANGGVIPPRPPRAERPKCGATTRAGHPCKMTAVWFKGEPAPRNGRCRLHGGLSTGPKTPEGRAAIAESNRRRARERHEQV